MANEQSPIFAAPVREGNTTADIGNRVDGTSDSTSEQSADDFQDGEDETSVQDDGKTQTDTGSPQDSDESSQEILEDSVQGDGQPQDDGDESKFQKLRSWWTGLSKKWKIVIGISLGLLVIGIIVGAIFGILASNDDGTESKKGDDEGEEKGNDEGDDKKEITTNRRTNYPTKTTTQKVEQVTLIPGGGSSGGSGGGGTTLIAGRTVTKGKVLSAVMPKFLNSSVSDCLLCRSWILQDSRNWTKGMFDSEEKTSAALWNLYSQTDATIPTFEKEYHARTTGGSLGFVHSKLNPTTWLKEVGENDKLWVDKGRLPFKEGDFVQPEPPMDDFEFGTVEPHSLEYPWGSPGNCPFWAKYRTVDGYYYKNTWAKQPMWKMGSVRTGANDGQNIQLRVWYKLNSWARHVYVALVPPEGAKYLYVSALITDWVDCDPTFVGLVKNEGTVDVQQNLLLNSGNLENGGTSGTKKIPLAQLVRISPFQADIDKFANDFPIAQKASMPTRPFEEDTQAPSMWKFDLTGRDQINIIGKINDSAGLYYRPETTWMYTKEELNLSDLAPS